MTLFCYKPVQTYPNLFMVMFRREGTLSNDDDGSENDGKKMNLRSFKLNRVYLDPLSMSNAGDFS